MTTYPESRSNSESAWALPATLRRILLLGPPLALMTLEIFHPQPDETRRP